MNHLDLIGWIGNARIQWAKLTGHEIKFKPATFYLGIADHLAKVVEVSEAHDTVTTQAGKGVSTVEDDILRSSPASNVQPTVSPTGDSSDDERR